MLYARVIIHNGMCKEIVKLVAESKEAYEAWKKEDIEESGAMTIVDEFVDENFGTITILPEDFRY